MTKFGCPDASFVWKQARWMFAFFTTVLLLTFARPLRIWHGDQAETVTLEEALFVPMALLLTPAETIVAVALAAIVGNSLRLRQTQL